MKAQEIGHSEDIGIRRSGEMDNFRRADTDKLKDVFLKYATKEIGGERYMTYEDFLLTYVEAFDEGQCNNYALELFGRAVDTTRTRLISFSEFQAFEALLCLPDATYALAFHIFDKNGSGYITCDEFVDILKHTELHDRLPFNFESDFVRLYFGKDLSRKVMYSEFTQLIHDYHDEHALQAFRRFDPEMTGYISVAAFEDIMKSLKGHLLSPFVKDNLTSSLFGSEHLRQISYSYFVAFISLLENMETIRKIFNIAAKQIGGKNAEVSKGWTVNWSFSPRREI